MKTKVWDMFLVTLSYLHLYPSNKITYPHLDWECNLLPLNSLSCSLPIPPTLEDSSPYPEDNLPTLEDSDLESSEYYAEDIISLKTSFDRNNSPLALKAPSSLLDLVQPKV